MAVCNQQLLKGYTALTTTESAEAALYWSHAHGKRASSLIKSYMYKDFNRRRQPFGLSVCVHIHRDTRVNISAFACWLSKDITRCPYTHSTWLLIQPSCDVYKASIQIPQSSSISLDNESSWPTPCMHVYIASIRSGVGHLGMELWNSAECLYIYQIMQLSNWLQCCVSMLHVNCDFPY